MGVKSQRHESTPVHPVETSDIGKQKEKMMEKLVLLEHRLVLLQHLPASTPMF